MSVEATSWAWRWIAAGEFTIGESLIFVRLADHADATGLAFPGNQHVAEITQASTRSVERLKTKLVEMGLATVEKRVLKRGRGRAFDCVELRLDREPDQPDNDDDQPDNGDTTNPTMTTDQPDNDDTPIDRRNRQEEPSKGTASDLGFSDEVIRLGSLLVDHVERESGDRKDPAPRAWLDSIDKMIRIDERTPRQIEYVIEWIGRDGEFWGSVILSGPKLREKWPQIVAKIKRETNGTSKRRSVGPSGEDLRKQADRLRREGR